MTGLADATTYTFRVVAFDAAGNETASGTRTVTTTDATAPTQPGTITVGTRTGSSIQLSWGTSSDNVGVVGYGLYVGGLRVGSTNEPSATFTGLNCGTSYDLGLDAVDAAGNRSSRSTTYFTTAACAPDRTPPSTPGQLAVQSASTGSVTLSWAAASDDRGVAGYGLYRGTTRVDSSSHGERSCGTTPPPCATTAGALAATVTEMRF